MKKRKKENLPKRSYEEVMEDFQKAQTPKEYRAVHKELWQNYHEWIPTWYRYPNAPIYISIVALIIAVLKCLFAD